MKQGPPPAVAISVLCIEDEDELRLDMLEELEAAGFAATGVASGEQALLQLSAQAYSIVLSDIRLPGMSGLDVLANIRKAQSASSTIPFVILSAYDDVHLRESLAVSRATAFLVKPVDYDDLIDTIQALTRPKPPAGDKVVRLS